MFMYYCHCLNHWQQSVSRNYYGPYEYGVRTYGVRCCRAFFAPQRKHEEKTRRSFYLICAYYIRFFRNQQIKISLRSVVRSQRKWNIWVRFLWCTYCHIHVFTYSPKRINAMNIHALNCVEKKVGGNPRWTCQMILLDVWCRPEHNKAHRDGGKKNAYNTIVFGLSSKQHNSEMRQNTSIIRHTFTINSR